MPAPNGSGWELCIRVTMRHFDQFMQMFITVILTGTAIYVMLAPTYGAETKRWATDLISAIFAYWLGRGSP
jgi:hypothetical protein